LSGKPREYAYAGKLEEAMRLETQAKAHEKIIEKELDIIGFKPNLKALDAGCGTGAVTRRIASRVPLGEVHGVDVDPLFIDEAKKLALKEGVKNIEFAVGNIDNLDYENETFDVSFCRLVLMHVRNPVKTIAELKRVTKKGGVVATSDNDDGAIITFPDVPKFFSLWSKYGKRAKARGDDRYIGRQLFSIFSEAGLNSICIYPVPVFATRQNLDVLKMLVYVPVKIVEQEKDSMIKEGVITAEDYEQAMREVQLALSHPGAFAMGLVFLATGRVS